MARNTFAALATLLVLCFACGDDTTVAPDAGMPDATTDGGSDAFATRDTGDVDATPTDVGTDAPVDAPADAGPSVPMLFAVIDDDLVTIDPFSGATTTIGPVGPIATSLTRMRWDDATSTLFAIYDVASGAPKLASLDVCTGAATALTDLTLPGGDSIGGFMFLDGQAFVSIDLDDDSNEETLATLDTTSGVVTTVVAFSTVIDADIFLRGSPVAIAIDQDPEGDTHIFHNVNIETGMVIATRSSSPRIAHQALHEGTIHGVTTGETSSLVWLEYTTAVATDIGIIGDGTGTFRAMSSGMSCP